MGEWCERCGWDKHSPSAVPCYLCWDRESDTDAEAASALAEMAVAKTPDAIRILERISDVRAAPVLRDLVDHEREGIRAAAVTSLAWMNQEPDVPLAFQAVEDPSDRVRRAGWRWLADLATEEAIEALAAASERSDDEDVHKALAWAHDPVLAARARTRDRARRLEAGRGVRQDPMEPRDVPRLAMKELVEDPPDPSDGAPARFGGQPDWVEQPAWPLGPGERPMVFYGQLPVPGRDATAYIFVSQDERVLSAEPLSDGNAVVVQPGPAPHTATAPRRNGPQLFQWLHDYSRFRVPPRVRRYRRWVCLEPGADPARWSWPELPAGQYPAIDHGDTNKVGGTPLFLQGEESPPGDGWRFGFQFSADWAGEELADGAECYGFFNDDGSGAFLWQCS